MDRMELIKKARQFAQEQVDGVAALNDTDFEELQKLPEEKAIETLAKTFLEDAVLEMNI